MSWVTAGGLEIEIVRRNIKNLHLGVYPPNGMIRAAVPQNMLDEAVRLMAVTRLPWLKKQVAKFKKQEREAPRKYVSGESHYFRGKRYLLKVIYHDGPPSIAIRKKTQIEMTVRRGSDLAKRREVLTEWYRGQLKTIVPGMLDRRIKVVKVAPSEWRVKLMKTKWGSCSVDKKRIWLNLELIKKPDPWIEYVILHELVHLLERTHNARFVHYMDRYLPNWRHIRDQLNDSPIV